MVRHPLERIESAWNLSRAAGRKGILLDALRGDKGIWQASAYWRTVQDYLQLFEPAQLHVVFFDDFKEHPEREARRCMQFLGVDHTARLREVARAPNRSSAMRARLIPASSLKNSKLVSCYRRITPASICSTLHKILTRPLAQERPWTDDTLEVARTLLGDDPTRFHEWARMPRDYWRLDDPLLSRDETTEILPSREEIPLAELDLAAPFSALGRVLQ